MFSTPERRIQRTFWLINVLDDAQNKSIEYANRFWLRQNVCEYKINICVEDSMVSKLEDIKEYLSSTGSFIIQDGKKFWAKQMDKKMDVNKEAIVCWRVKDYEHFNYLAFLYRPKDE